MRTLINWTEAVKAIPSSADCRHRIDALWTQGRSLALRCRHALDAFNLREKLMWVFAEMRGRLDRTQPRSEWLAHTFHRALATVSRPRKPALIVAAAGMAALVVIVCLLEISVRRQLASEAGDIVTGSIASAPSPIGSTQTELADRIGALGAASLSDQAQTFGQAVREPVPLPRPRKPR
jgi:hypothetical protein